MFAADSRGATAASDPLGKLAGVRLTEHNFDKVRTLHANWYLLSVKALMAQLGRELYLKLERGEFRVGR